MRRMRAIASRSGSSLPVRRLVAPMLRALIPPLISSSLAALVGAGVGGWITYSVVTENTRTQLVMSAYDFYLSEAARAYWRAKNGEFTEEDKARLQQAAAGSAIFASKEVLCRVFAFQEKIFSTPQDGEVEYLSLMFAIRAEALGEEIGDEKCSWSPPTP